MMKSASTIAMVALCALHVSCAAPDARSIAPPDETVASGFLDWTQLGDATWQMDRMAASIGPTEQSGFLVSAEEYHDFRLSVEFKIDDGVNSGVFIRCNDTTAVATITPVSCYELNIWDNHPNQSFRTGSIVTLVQPRHRVDTLGRWNTYEITASGTSVRVILNGVETATLEDAELLSGRLALQYMGGGELQFRNLRVEPL